MQFCDTINRRQVTIVTYKQSVFIQTNVLCEHVLGRSKQNENNIWLL